MELGVKSCVVPGCKVFVSSEKMMCFQHWVKVPSEHKRNVYVAYKKGIGRSYLAAREAAIKSVTNTGGQNGSDRVS